MYICIKNVPYKMLIIEDRDNIRFWCLMVHGSLLWDNNEYVFFIIKKNVQLSYNPYDLHILS